MKATFVSRGDLLDDPRFWALVYEYGLKPRAGDSFDDGEHHFFSIKEAAVKDFYQELEAFPVAADSYPNFSVVIPLRTGWQVGVVLSMFPEDFEIQDVLIEPSSSDLLVVGVNGGNSKLPVFRWEELLLLADQVQPNLRAMRERVILMLYPSVVLTRENAIPDVRRILKGSWIASGLPIRNIDELVDRFMASQYDERLLWRLDENVGWVNNGLHSLRNPENRDAASVIAAMQAMFSSLE